MLPRHSAAFTTELQQTIQTTTTKLQNRALYNTLWFFEDGSKANGKCVA